MEKIDFNCGHHDAGACGDLIDRARAYYIGGGGTLRSVAERFEIPYRKLAAVSASESWCKRRQYAERGEGGAAAVSRPEKCRGDDGTFDIENSDTDKDGAVIGTGDFCDSFDCGRAESDSFSGGIRNLCGLLTGRIRGYIEDEEQFNRYLIKDGKDSQTVETVYGKADVKSIKEMALALKALSECAANLSEREASEAFAPENHGGSAEGGAASELTVRFIDDAGLLAE